MISVSALSFGPGGVAVSACLSRSSGTTEMCGAHPSCTPPTSHLRVALALPLLRPQQPSTRERQSRCAFTRMMALGTMSTATLASPLWKWPKDTTCLVSKLLVAANWNVLRAMRTCVTQKTAAIPPLAATLIVRPAGVLQPSRTRKTICSSMRLSAKHRVVSRAKYECLRPSRTGCNVAAALNWIVTRWPHFRTNPCLWASLFIQQIFDRCPYPFRAIRLYIKLDRYRVTSPCVDRILHACASGTMQAQLIAFPPTCPPPARTPSGFCSPLCLTRTCTLLLLLLHLLPSRPFTLHAPPTLMCRTVDGLRASVHRRVSAESRHAQHDRCKAPCAARAVTGDESATRTRFVSTPTFPFCPAAASL